MREPTKDDTRPIRPVHPQGEGAPKLDRRLVYVLLIGLVAGSLLTVMVGYGMVLGGALSVGSEACPTAVSVCPSTPAFLPVCPTCGVVVATPTHTSTPTATIDAAATASAATATAACSAFESQFPGTPCPTQP
jgi:hypothetical protein